MFLFTLRSSSAREAMLKISSANPRAFSALILARASSSLAGTSSARKLNVNGVQIHCVTTNNNGDASHSTNKDTHNNNQKPALLCMPGCLSGAEADFASQLRGLSDAFQVVSYDPRGYGQSQPPRRDFPLDFYQRDADDAAAVMQDLGHERYSVMGFSDGAISAVMLAATSAGAGTPTKTNKQKDGEQQHIVNKLIIFGGSAYYTKEDTVIWNASRNVSEWPASEREKHFAVYGDDFASIWSDAVDAWVSLANRNGGNVCMDQAKSITCPTLVLHGAKDPMVVKAHPEWFANNIPGNGNTRLHVFPSGTHAIQHDCTDEFNGLVRDFLLSS